MEAIDFSFINFCTIRNRSQIKYFFKSVKLNPNKEIKGVSYLNLSILHSNSLIVSELLQKGANPNLQSKNGITPIFFAMYLYLKSFDEQYIDIIKNLISFGAIINKTDVLGQSLLELAIRSKNLNLIETLLINGANIYVRNPVTKLSICEITLKMNDIYIIQLLENYMD
jgi:ankyrin repeat protein